VEKVKYKCIFIIGGKALCAGGDVKSLYLAKTSPSDECP
jgi:hypothetical protein